MPTNQPTIPEFDYDQLGKILSNTTSDEQLFRKIVDAPFTYHVQTVLMFLGIIVLLQVNKATKTIDRVALSNTDLAHSTTRVSTVPFHQIKISCEDTDNLIAKAIRSGEPQQTADWKYLFTPALNETDARINQASAGIASSRVYPLESRDGGALIFSYFQYPQYIGDVQKQFMRQYSKLVDKALAIAN